MSDQALVLLVEDNEDDVALVRRAFSKGKVVNPLQVVRTGEEAVEYLTGTGRYSNREEYPLPELMLLDLRLPGIDGFQVLHWLRQQPSLKSLRVVVLTASDALSDATQAYQFGANSFLVKPIDFDEFVNITNAIQGYWLWTSRSPELKRPDRTKNQ
ncbi:MAG TPA: response regulator [Verrucomicrobiae bacterium]|nr:response regulator [Verrucomicrobiae bacterium]